jgi:hypothetical protein
MTFRSVIGTNRGWRAAAALAAVVAAFGPDATAAQGGLTGALGLPARCEPGKSCWLTVYVDDDPGAGARDYACGELTVNGHDGIDFAIRDTVAMSEGVDVLAAAAGTVKVVRDGAPDVNVRTIGFEAVKGRECGNGVVIDHGDGWATQYCHLRSLSIAVKPGQAVAAGQTIAKVGMSGLAEYPHVHFAVAHEGKAVDPFRGLAAAPACGVTAASLWRRDVLAALPSGRGALYSAGVTDAVPSPDGAQAGEYRAPTLARQAPALVVWGNVFNVAPGDVMSFRLVGPTGETLAENRHTVDRKQVRLLRYTGKRRPADSWPAGTYRGEVAFDPAGDAPPERMQVTVEVR